LESQDRAEVDRIKVNVEKCRKTLQNLGYTDFTFEDFFALFLEQLDDILQGTEESISYDELVNRSRDQSVSDYIVMFFRFVTAGDIRTRADFFEPFITGLSNATVDQVCTHAYSVLEFRPFGDMFEILFFRLCDISVNFNVLPNLLALSLISQRCETLSLLHLCLN
jgi:serine/threonine protein kinase